ncbi:MAG: D-hexose-6-phosphate mutarotase [Verrucomicrobiales bacterium]|nr:D-hexose-6-phosphate mutarotase [Verrucomicrobiales bacterium]
MPHEIPDRVKLSPGNGGLPKVTITSDWSTAEIYLHGAHVTHFQKNGEPPVLFMSDKSRFQKDSPIRGGIPIILPWFGSRDGHAAHGFARLQDWELTKTSENKGAITLHFKMPECPAAAEFPPFSVEYIVTVAQSLTCDLQITNNSKHNFSLEDCLHTYFQVGDINQISVTGLKGVDYLDQMENFARKTETNEAIKITSETDRIYLDTESTVEILDKKLNRRIRVAKSGSRSTVLWNPWIEKSKRMPDFGDDEFHNMVCVESCNVTKNERTIAAGETSSLKIELSTAVL